ncbi:unnamed protein product [Gemmataceae bacterium]|nr:unnamed protein product [Gemmataceae bacterium]VTU00486.1 unnamed protein product [Gemmataceae bacterium]
MLAVLGAVTFGSTSAFGLVLCVEWLLDPRRPDGLRRWDAVGALLAVPGVLFFVWLSAEHFGGREREMIAAYWGSFAVWLLFRAWTRWPAISAPRR